jgi:ubiquinol-cytochrome c reductase cytochrome b subunit
MPLLGRWKLGHGFNIGLLIILLIGVGLLTGAAVNEDYRKRWTDKESIAELSKVIDEVGTDDKKIAAHYGNDEAKIHQYKEQLAHFDRYNKSKEYLQAVEEADQEAERIVTLASSPARIPPSGAITLLRNDPKTQGPKLFARNCASCHSYAAPDANADESQTAKKPTAPNLHGFASRTWLKGFLDAKQIAGPKYFGNTSHREGQMVDFVRDTMASWSPEEVQNVVVALSAEAHLKSQAEADRKDAAQIDAGRKLIVADDRCVSCHKFHDAGELGSAPDLSGYGSREWLSGMISDPKHQRFYREDNDRMPSFAEHPDDPGKNMLSAHSLGLIVDWLRGEWYKPPIEPAPAEQSPAEQPPAEKKSAEQPAAQAPATGAAPAAAK